MKIKRFIAASMRDAMRMVREEQGSDAVILSNRRVEGGIEVVAATDYDAALVQSAAMRSEGPLPSTQSQPPARPESEETPRLLKPAPADSVPKEALQRSVRVLEPVQTFPNSKNIASNESASSSDPSYVRYLLKREAPEPAVPGNARPASAQPSVARAPLMRPRLEPERIAPAHTTCDSRATTVETPNAPNPGASEIDTIKSEMQTMRRLMEQRLGGSAWSDLKTRNPVRASVIRSMTDIGLELKLAREIATELPDDATAERARFLPMSLLARRIPAFKHEWLDAGGAKNDVIALVGPTGVGKTTTIAKLAARYVQNWGLRDVALVTTDHFRIGAQEQLFTYGRLLGVPVLTADNQAELCQALDKLRDRKLVLIDTAGMSPRDANLDRQFAMLSGLSVPIRTALVMSAGSQGADIDDQFKRFAPADPSAVILTKLDEASRIGPALSAVIRHGLPIAYVTDGQRVPEDLSAARPDQLVLRAMPLSRKPPEPADDDELSFQFAGAAHA